MYEQGKPRLVSLDVLKEFTGDNGVHGLPSDPSHSEVLETDEMREVPNLMPALTVMYRYPTDLVSTGTGNSSYPENQAEREDEIAQNNSSRILEETPPPSPSLKTMPKIWKCGGSSWKPKIEMELSSQSVTQVLISF